MADALLFVYNASLFAFDAKSCGFVADRILGRDLRYFQVDDSVRSHCNCANDCLLQDIGQMDALISVKDAVDVPHIIILVALAFRNLLLLGIYLKEELTEWFVFPGIRVRTDEEPFRNVRAIIKEGRECLR